MKSQLYDVFWFSLIVIALGIFFLVSFLIKCKEKIIKSDVK